MQPSLLEKQPEDENETGFCDVKVIITTMIIGRDATWRKTKRGRQSRPSLREQRSRVTSDVSLQQATAHRKS